MFFSTLYINIKNMLKYITQPSRYYSKKYAKRYAKKYSIGLYLNENVDHSSSSSGFV